MAPLHPTVGSGFPERLGLIFLFSAVRMCRELAAVHWPGLQARRDWAKSLFLYWLALVRHQKRADEWRGDSLKPTAFPNGISTYLQRFCKWFPGPTIMCTSPWYHLMSSEQIYITYTPDFKKETHKPRGQ